MRAGDSASKAYRVLPDVGVAGELPRRLRKATFERFRVCVDADDISSAEIQDWRAL